MRPDTSTYPDRASGSTALLLPTHAVGDAGAMCRWAASAATGWLLVLCVVAGDARAASDHFVPAFSFWSGAPVTEGARPAAPRAAIAPARMPPPTLPGAAAEPAAGAVPVKPPVVNLLLANPGGAPLTTTDPRPRDETERWVPAFAFTTGAFIQDVNGSQTPGIIENYRNTAQEITGEYIDLVPGAAPGQPGFGLCAPASCFPGPVVGDSRFVAPTMGLSLELSTPGLSFLPTRPRLFAHIDGRVDFAYKRSTARFLSPEDLVAENASPDLPLPFSDPHFQEGGFDPNSIRGQGTKVEGELLPWMYGGGVGVAFTMEVFERRLRIKPSAEYLHTEMRATGTVNRAVTAFPGDSVPGSVRQQARFIFIELEGQKTQEFHMLGPGLEIEMDTLRLGPAMLSLFANARAYTILGDREISFTVSETIENPAVGRDGNPFPISLAPPPNGHGVQTASSDFSLVLPEWNYDLGLGLRFRWLPEGSWR